MVSLEIDLYKDGAMNAAKHAREVFLDKLMWIS